MTELIQGLKLDFTAAELQQHLDERIAHHDRRAEFYDTETQRLKEGGVDASPQYQTAGNPVEMLARSAKDHHQRTAILQIFRDHLVRDATYRLTEADLDRIELHQQPQGTLMFKPEHCTVKCPVCGTLNPAAQDWVDPEDGYDEDTYSGGDGESPSLDFGVDHMCQHWIGRYRSAGYGEDAYYSQDVADEHWGATSFLGGTLPACTATKGQEPSRSAREAAFGELLPIAEDVYAEGWDDVGWPQRIVGHMVERFGIGQVETCVTDSWTSPSITYDCFAEDPKAAVAALEDIANRIEAGVSRLRGTDSSLAASEAS